MSNQLKLTFCEGMIRANKKNKKAGGINILLGINNSFSQKNLTRAIFILGPAPNMLGTRRHFLGCMKRIHALFFGVDL